MNSVLKSLACLLFTVMALPAVAAQPIDADRQQRFGDVTVHYSTFSSTFLQPQVAQQLQLIRSKQQGVINLSVLKQGQAQAAQVSGSLKSLSGDSLPLNFRVIRETGAIYYVAQYPVPQQETRIFDLKVETGGVTHRFSFNQELFPDP